MLPQVWLVDQYGMFHENHERPATKPEAIAKTADFVRQLRAPGVYRVGGLGACTLVARSALESGLRFEEIDNIGLWGEDRHFCIRARVLGIELWADTRYPPLHLYRDSDLARLPAWRLRTDSDFLAKPKLTLSMVVRNEASRWLEGALRAHRPFIDAATIVDDASTDDTVDVVQRALDGIPLRLVRNKSSKFANEHELRRQQWEESVATNPDWLLILDGDEILEERASHIVPQLMRQTEFALFGFRLFDFWNETHYRDDKLWSAHQRPWPLLVRYNPDVVYTWQETAQHCGRMPSNVLGDFNAAAADLAVKHMGWSTEAERKRKYARYQELDPGARYGARAQYESILDPAPNLTEWRASS
jgi:hypothetical protein